MSVGNTTGYNYQTLTEASDSRQGGEEDDPVVAPPNDPAPVEQYEIAQEVAYREQDVRSDKWFGLDCDTAYAK